MIRGVDHIDKEFNLGLDEIVLNTFEVHQIGIAVSDTQGKILQSNAQIAVHIPNWERCNLIQFTKSKTFKIVGTDAQEYEFKFSGYTLKVVRKIVPHPQYSMVFLWSTHLVDHHPQQQVRYLQNVIRVLVHDTFGMIVRTSKESILFGNELFIKSFGFSSKKEMLNSSFASLFYSQEEYQNLLKIIDEQKVLNNYEFTFKALNGEKIIGLIKGRIYYDHSGREIIHWTILDVTLKKRYEMDYESKNQQLEKVNSQVEGFLYRASHDLRGPVTSIYGLINLLSIESSDPLVEEYLDKMEECTLKMDTIIKDMMSFSKTSYKRSFSERIYFEDVIKKILNSQFGEANYDKIDFEVNVEDDFCFFSDPQRIEIILDNLIRNAIMFYDPSKVSPNVQIKIRTNMDSASIQIIDNGIGISKNHVNNIFNMFYKVSDHSKGSGLGLYIVKEGVYQLNASIKVESEVGFGSMFQISIPNDKKGRLINRKLLLEKSRATS